MTHSEYKKRLTDLVASYIIIDVKDTFVVKKAKISARETLCEALDSLFLEVIGEDEKTDTTELDTAHGDTAYFENRFRTQLRSIITGGES
jgi:hypothetical protein